MGRAAIGTAFREDKTARKVTLSKRKKGIYKKCQELAQLCAVEIAVMCVGQFSKPSSFVATPEGPKEADLSAVAKVCRNFNESVVGKGPELGAGEAEMLQMEVQQLRALCSRLQQDVSKQEGGDASAGPSEPDEMAQLRMKCAALQQEVATLRREKCAGKVNPSPQINSSTPSLSGANGEHDIDMAIAAGRLASLTAAAAELN